MVRPWASFHKHEQSQRMVYMFRALYKCLEGEVQTRLSSRGMWTWHKWEPPGRPTLSLWYQHKGQAKGSFINLNRFMENQHDYLSSQQKGDVWRICSRWLRHFCRPLESQLYEEHLESTESWSKVGWCGIVKDFFKKYKKDPGKETPWILQNSHASLGRVASNASARKVSLSKGKVLKALWLAQ